MINFSEISMIGQYPWGGFGANPLPGRFQRLWNIAKHKLTGIKVPRIDDPNVKYSTQKKPEKNE